MPKVILPDDYTAKFFELRNYRSYRWWDKERDEFEREFNSWKMPNNPFYTGKSFDKLRETSDAAEREQEEKLKKLRWWKRKPSKETASADD